MKKFDLDDPRDRQVIFEAVLAAFDETDSSIECVVSAVLDRAYGRFSYEGGESGADRWAIEAWFVAEFKTLARALWSRGPHRSDWREARTRRLIRACGLVFIDEPAGVAPLTVADVRELEEALGQAQTLVVRAIRAAQTERASLGAIAEELVAALRVAVIGRWAQKRFGAHFIGAHPDVIRFAGDIDHASKKESYETL